MPARTQLFDSKAKPVHSFGSQHRNVLLYQPQGKLLLSAGFGNLAGGVDVWDVSTRQKVAEFKWVLSFMPLQSELSPGFPQHDLTLMFMSTGHPTRLPANGRHAVDTS